jgi:thioredoxin 1
MLQMASRLHSLFSIGGEDYLEGAMIKPVEVSDSNFENEVIHAGLPVLLGFWAPWWGPCRVMTPIIEELGSEYEGKIKVGKLNTQKNLQVTLTLGINKIPTAVLFDGAYVVDMVEGVRAKGDIRKMIDNYLKQGEGKKSADECRKQTG